MFSVSKQIHGLNQPCQDRAEFIELGSSLVLILADGAGGMSGGAEAAEFVVQSVKQRVPSTSLTHWGLVALLMSIDRKMAELGAYGETTAVIAVLSDQALTGASVGDSGAYLFSNGTIENLTEKQMRKPFLGSGSAFPLGFSRPSADGTVLVASDGLLKYSSMEKISAIAVGPDLEESSQKLVQLVRYPSGALPDDVSILLARSL
jgi:serine/threonine protein phosphatase PrpC